MDPDSEWFPDGWWMVVGPDGELWCESSSERENRERIRPGDTLWRHEKYVQQRWVKVEERPL